MTKKKLNCWEYFHCGRELEPEDLSFTICPAARDKTFDGINDGKNNGRFCWSVFGTFCKERGHGVHHEMRLTCEICEFYKLVKEEEAENFVLLRPDQTHKDSE